MSSARVRDLRQSGAVEEVLDIYAPYRSDGVRTDSALRAVIDHAVAVGAKTVVTEFRYVDADWRSEYSEFYSKTFRSYPDVAHRLHFFSQPIDLPESDDLAGSDPDYAAFGYLGYCIVRPLPAAPVGRTLLVPLTDDVPYVSCIATDVVHLFGQRLTVTGVPMMGQDGQLGVCGHASAWIIGYIHTLAYRHPRVLPAAIAKSAARGHSSQRPVPAARVNVHQLTVALTAMRLPPLVYEIGYLPPMESQDSVVIRYLDSGLPVMLAGDRHTKVIVGYKPADDGTYRYLVQDDQAGPYQWTALPDLHDEDEESAEPPDPLGVDPSTNRRLTYLLIPLPEKVFLSGDEAEVVAKLHLTATYTDSGSAPVDVATTDAPDNASVADGAGSDRSSDPVGFPDEAADELVGLLADGTAQVRSVLMRSNTLKARAGTRYAGQPQLSALLRYHPMSRFVWLVQIARSAPADGAAAVIAEVIVDATEHTLDPHVLAWWTLGEAVVWFPDFDAESEPLRLAGVEPLPFVTARA